MQELSKGVAIITGASSGIGEATAKRLSKEGIKLVLGARRMEKLEKIKTEIEGAGGEVTIQQTDVTKKEDVDRLVQRALDEYGHVNLLFNNAGIMPLSFMEKTKIDEWEQMVDVNIKGVLYGINAVLPYMIEKNEGHIITTSSVAGHEIMPSSAVYSGTKYAVRVIMEGLNKELKDKNIRLTSISPGAVATELTNTITDDDVKEMFGNQDMEPLNPENIAEAVYYAITQPQNVSINEIIVRPNGQG